MPLDEKKVHELKKQLKVLGRVKGRHTELVSVLIPAGSNLADIVSMLRSEMSTSENIKSKAVRNNVTSAIEKIIRHLTTYYKKTPDNGLAVYCGNVSEKEGGIDIQIFPIEPPEPLRAKLYWCSQKFELEPLLEMVEEKEVYGIICMDRSEADVALLVGKKLKSISHMESIVPGKTRAGGQSSARFARVREGLMEDWMKEIADAANKIFTEHKEIQGIIISGPGPSKEIFMRQDLLHSEIKKKILGTVDTSYTGEFGLGETVERGEELLKESAIVRERNLLQGFLSELQKPYGLVVYGLKETIEAIQRGAVERILLVENAPYVKVKYDTEEGPKEEFIPISKLESVKRLVHKWEIDEAMEDLASQFNSQLILVTAETREGQQFSALGGIGGFLRYRLQ
jgi:peptide chain release factor subunit 1